MNKTAEDNEKTFIIESSCYAAFPLCGTGLREKISVLSTSLAAPFNVEIVGR